MAKTLRAYRHTVEYYDIEVLRSDRPEGASEEFVVSLRCPDGQKLDLCFTRVAMQNVIQELNYALSSWPKE